MSFLYKSSTPRYLDLQRNQSNTLVKEKSPDEIAVLQKLSGQVERDVLAVDNALDESKPSWQDLVGLGKNEHFFAVKGNANVTFLADVEHV